MPVKQILNALGSWDINLKTTTPPDLWDALDYFGHIAFIPGRLDPAQYGDNLLDVARYVGVVRGRETSGDDRRTTIVEQGYVLRGVGMAFWLGDEDGKGDVFENAVEPASASFATAINMLLPASGAVTAGTIHTVPGTYSGRHQYETPREAIQYVCQTFTASSGSPVSWRVNGDGTLDAGHETDLFVTDPTCVISRKPAGQDIELESVPGAFGVTRDAEDFSTRVLLLAEGEGESIATGSADINPGNNPYKDIHGNPLKLTRLASESDTSVTLADTRAELLLSQYTSTQDELVVETDDYYIEGAFDVGDYVWVYDENAGLYDTGNEIVFRGERLNPIKLQVTETTWPVHAGYMVAYRAADGTWYDLTDHVDWDGSDTVYVTVGGFARALAGAGTEPIGSRPNADTSVPGVPAFTEPFEGSAYLDARGFTRARAILEWTAPLNVDGSTILDGDHYEIRYAVDTDMIYPATWAQLSQVRWMDLQTWAQPFAAPDGDWQIAYAPWGTSTLQLNDLSPGVGYDVQIRAVDKTGNTGAWSGTTTFVASVDNIPPSTPAAPSVAASRIAVQVTHSLGKNSGGTYNLESDLAHLEVHADYEPHFTPSDATLLGKLRANSGLISAQIPAVGTFTVESTDAVYLRVIAVDETGNRSGASPAASATALLIDDAHISDLTVSKITAGTITASWVMAGEIKTADSGARARMSSDGFETYNAAGTRTFFADATTGDIEIVGQLASGTSGRRLVVNPTDATKPEIRFYPSTGSAYGLLSAWDQTGVPGTDAAVQLKTSDDANGVFSVVGMDTSIATFGRYELGTSGTSYYGNGGFVRASDDGLLGGWFSGEGGDFGGIVEATSTLGTVGYFGAAADTNYLECSSDGITRHYGTWSDFPVAETNRGIFTGSTGLTGGTVVNIDYGPTMDSQLLPLYTVRDDIVHSSAATGADADGFQITVSPAGNGSWALYFWAFRIP